MYCNLSEKEILENGYNEYEPSKLSFANRAWQKVIKDNIGKRYFIDIEYYNMTHPSTKDDLSGYSIKSQVYLKDNHNALNLEFLDSSIEEAEEFIDNLFNEGKLDYYERF